MKLLALAQHLNIPFIDGIGEYYFGLSKEDYDNYYFDRDGQPKLALPDWIKEQDSYIDFENDVEVNGDYYTYEGEEYLILNVDEVNMAWVGINSENCEVTVDMETYYLYRTN